MSVFGETIPEFPKLALMKLREMSRTEWLVVVGVVVQLACIGVEIVLASAGWAVICTAMLAVSLYLPLRRHHLASTRAEIAMLKAKADAIPILRDSYERELDQLRDALLVAQRQTRRDPRHNGHLPTEVDITCPGCKAAIKKVLSD